MTLSASQPPAPEAAGDWLDFTEKLRELHTWAGSPKYDALSNASGLANSAISGLIGKNPLRRPSRSASLRFVESCLAQARLSPEEVATQTARWEVVWDALDAGTADQLVVPPSASLTTPKHGRPRMILAGAALAGAVAAVVVIVMTGGNGDRNAGATSPTTSPTTTWTTTLSTTPIGTPSVARCVEKRTAVQDVRFDRTWRSVFVCSNVPAKIYAGPAVGAPVAILKSNPSWFICWAEGAVGKNDNRIWYYTQGDLELAHKEWNSWGFVQADDVEAFVHPDPGVTRECPDAILHSAK